MDRKLTGKRPTFSTNKTTINYTFVLILVALIGVGLWFASQVHDPEGRFEPLFLPTPTATRTVASLVLEGEAYFEAGKIYDPEGKDAIDAYYDVLERHPDNAQVRAELARLLVYSSALLSTTEERTERLSLARQEIQQAVDLAPSDSTVQAIKALVLDWSSTSTAASQAEKQDWINQAEQAANLAITLDPNNSLALAFYAEVLLDQNQKAQAEEHARLAVQQGPELMDTHRVYGTVLESLGEYVYAIEEFEKATEINPNLTFLYIRIGVIYRALKVYDVALEYFSKAITINQSNGVEDPLPYIAIAKTYSRDGEFFIAAVNGEKAIAINPDDADAYYNMGNVYLNLGKNTEAIATYKKSIAIKPTKYAAYMRMAFAYRKLKKYPEALAAYKKCVALKPDDVDAYLHLGSAYDKLEQYQEALAAYKKAIALKPTGKGADFARKKISEIENRDKP